MAGREPLWDLVEKTAHEVPTEGGGLGRKQHSFELRLPAACSAMASIAEMVWRPARGAGAYLRVWLASRAVRPDIARSKRGQP